MNDFQDVTNDVLKELYPTESWQGRLSAALDWR